MSFINDDDRQTQRLLKGTTMNKKTISTMIALPVAGFVAGGILIGGIAAANTPQPTGTASCIEALNHADDLNAKFGEAIEISSDAIGHAGAFDWTALDEDTRKIEQLTPGVSAARMSYDSAAAECRSGQS